jgi:hypothetical protein
MIELNANPVCGRHAESRSYAAQVRLVNPVWIIASPDCANCRQGARCRPGPRYPGLQPIGMVRSHSPNTRACHKRHKQWAMCPGRPNVSRKFTRSSIGSLIRSTLAAWWTPVPNPKPRGNKSARRETRGPWCASGQLCGPLCASSHAYILSRVGSHPLSRYPTLCVRLFVEGRWVSTKVKSSTGTFAC